MPVRSVRRGLMSRGRSKMDLSPNYLAPHLFLFPWLSQLVPNIESSQRYADNLKINKTRKSDHHSRKNPGQQNLREGPSFLVLLTVSLCSGCQARMFENCLWCFCGCSSSCGQDTCQINCHQVPRYGNCCSSCVFLDGNRFKT